MAWILKNKVKWAAADPGTSGAIDTTGADLLVVLTTRFNASDPFGGNFSDSKSNTWHALTESSSGATPVRAKMAYATKHDGGFSVGASHTFTFLTGTFFMAIEVLAFSGSDFSVDSFDVENGATAASGTSLATGSVTPSSSGALLVTVVSSLGSSHVMGNSFTTEDQYDYSPGNYIGGGFAWKEHASGAINPSWSWTTSSDVATRIAAFKGTGGGGGGTNSPYAPLFLKQAVKRASFY